MSTGVNAQDKALNKVTLGIVKEISLTLHTTTVEVRLGDDRP